MRKLLLLSVLGLSTLASPAHPGLPENPTSIDPCKESNSSNPGYAGNQDSGLWLQKAKRNWHKLSRYFNTRDRD